MTHWTLADYEIALAALRLQGLLAGRFASRFPGEIFWLLGAVHGAGS